MATYKKIKEEVKEGLKKAIKERKGSAIARHCNVPRGTIHSFARQGSATPYLVLEIGDWLTLNGYMEFSRDAITFDDPKEAESFKLSLLTPDISSEEFTITDAKTLIRDFLDIADSGILKDDQFWRLLKINCETLMREAP